MLRRLAATFAKSTFRQTVPLAVSMTMIDTDGDKHSVEGDAGDTLYEVGRAAGVEFSGYCGGNGVCGTCHCHVLEGIEKFPEMEMEEEDTLDMVDDLTELSRLACQIEVSDDLEDVVIQFME